MMREQSAVLARCTYNMSDALRALATAGTRIVVHYKYDKTKLYATWPDPAVLLQDQPNEVGGAHECEITEDVAKELLEHPNVIDGRSNPAIG